MRISLFIPCFVDQLAPEVGLATARVLEGLGHEVQYEADQTCCGQPALNAGQHAHAESLARRQFDILRQGGAEAIVAPSGSCVAALKETLRGQAGVDPEALDRIWELSQFLVDVLDVEDVGASLPRRVTFHDSCHPLRELGIKDQPRRLLAAVKGLDLVEMDHSEECCGFGGTFAVKYPEVSVGMGERKIRSVLDSGAQYVVSTESSCLMQIRGLLERQGSAIGAVHIASILAGDVS